MKAKPFSCRAEGGFRQTVMKEAVWDHVENEE